MNDNLKKYQLYKELRNLIRAGTLKPGEKLAAEPQLALEFHVSRVTLRGALDLLAQDQLLERVPRKGTFVARNIGGGSYLAISDFENTALSSPVRYILPGLEKRLGEAGRKLECCSQRFIQSLNTDSAEAIFKKNRIDGVFLLENNFNGDEKELLLLKNCGLPVIAPHGQLHDREHFTFPLLLSDIRQAFGDGVRHLAELGHRRIGTLGSTQEGKKNIYCRDFTRPEYLELLEYNHLDTDRSLLETAAFDHESIRLAVRRMVFGARPPSAIICFSDFFAIHVYDALKELNIRIPEQMSIMGFCGYPGGRFMDPPLSTVDLQYEDIGLAAAELMLKSSEWFETGEPPLTIFTPYRIMPGKSTRQTNSKFISIQPSKSRQEFAL